jgi:pimeloyl-ACP methyl ester carboxylesterase
MGKSILKDIIIVLPGICGSVLQRDGKDVWNCSSQSITQYVRSWGNSLSQLELSQDAIVGSEDNVEATGLIRGAHIIPGLHKVLCGYEILSSTIQREFQVEMGNRKTEKPANFFEFPYDWRYHSRYNAELLATFVEHRLKIWRDYTGNPNAKVILLAHSLGGLISRYYIEVLGGWQDCKALFSFGTPYRGSIDSIDYLANGYKAAGIIPLTKVLQSLPSVYELLPRHTVLQVNGRYESITQASVPLPNINPKKALDAWAFHQKISEALLQQPEEYWDSPYKIKPFIGIKQSKTKQSAFLHLGNLHSTNEKLPPEIDALYQDGDGTVPYWSAIPQEPDPDRRSKVDRIVYVPETHGAIQSNPQALRQLIRELKVLQDVKGLGNVLGPTDQDESGEAATLSLTVDDLYAADEEVVVQAEMKDTNQDFGGIKAEIKAVEGEVIHRLTLEQQSEGWMGAITGLAPGMYEVTIKPAQFDSGAPQPVRDLFEVMPKG